MTPSPAHTVTGGSNRSRNQGQNPNRYEWISTCKSCGYWNPHDPYW